MLRRTHLYVTALVVWLLAAAHAPPLTATVLAEDSATSATNGSVFVFQGKLTGGSGAINGACDFSFTLFDAAQAGTRIGDPITRPALAVVDGVFQTVLDYGATAFTAPRWLEISVRCPAGSGSFAVLSPRQQLQAVPYAVSALNAPDGFTVYGQAWVNGTGIFGRPGVPAALSLRSPDVYLNADPSFARGNGGRALVHDKGDVLHINMENDFGGGVEIEGKVIISGSTTIRNPLYVNGNDIWLNGEAKRGDGGRALVHFDGDALYVNYGNDFSGGVVLDSQVRVVKDLLVTQDLSVEGDSLRLLGNDLFLRGDADRGNGGRALVHTVGDTLEINYEDDFAGGVRITNLRTGGIVEENLMTPAQRQGGALPAFTQGDVLCWDGDRQQLDKCRVGASPLVVAVADKAGRPLVMGVEPVKVTGTVAPGDLLVSADRAGFAQAWPRSGGDPPAGVMVGKALEGSTGAAGAVMALIQLQ